MHTVYIGIGSNLGRREENCETALRLLSKKEIGVTARSSIYETEPWGVKDQPAFINLAVCARTALAPHDLLKTLKEIEQEIGREETGRWGPRKIDLDILLYDDVIVNEPGLVIPHPLMHERDFVLRPLSEIAPDMVHPVLKEKIKDLLKNRC